MSLILDALRKSEHERQREAGAALSVVPESGPARRAPRWMPVLVVLLALNAVVLALVLLREPSPGAEPPTPPAATPERAAAASAQPAAVTPPAATPAPTETEPAGTALELPAKPPRAEVRPLTTELPTPGTADRPAPPQPTATGAATAPAPAQQAEADARLPRFADLVVRGDLNVPHMHLDIHVYSGDPAQRFVFINMQRYNEGEATAEGPSVERIVPDGVVMSHRGQRFLLTRD